MSFKEKQIVTGLVVGTLMVLGYCLYVATAVVQGSLELSDARHWAIIMLVCIAIGVVIHVISLVLMHILMAVSIALSNGSCNDDEIKKQMESAAVEDERDKLIELKSSRITLIFMGLAFFCGLVSLALGASVAVLLNILFFSAYTGNVIEGLRSLAYYKKGIPGV